MKKVWGTQDGDEIPYKNLTNDHLKNILRWIKRRADAGITYEGGGNDPEDFWSYEYEMHGQEVLDYFDYDGLQKEAKKRKLV